MGHTLQRQIFFVIVMFYGFSTRANLYEDVKNGRRGWSS